MKIKRNCKVCNTEFVAIKSTHLFCKRKCFKRDLYSRQKELIAAENRNPKFPMFNCNICGMQSQLEFDPIKYQKRFDAHTCPHCQFAQPCHWLRNTYFVFTYTEVVTTDEFGNTSILEVIKNKRRPF